MEYGVIKEEQYCNHLSLHHSLKIIGGAVCLWFIAEVSLQLRSQAKFGQSVFNLLTSETRYITNPQSGLLTFRPNMHWDGKDIELATNAQGLRNAPVSTERKPGSLRLVFIGASTVMGAYARNNQQTSSALLQKLLQKQYPRQQVEVINAGIPGYSLKQQIKMLQYAEQQYAPDGYLLYTGNNDFAGYCKQKTTKKTSRWRQLSLPSWLLSTDLIFKNTVPLRPASTATAKLIDPTTLDLSPYRQSLRLLLQQAKQNKKDILVVTNAKAYRPEQPVEEQLKLSETARFYNSCFDLPALHQLYDLHNQQIRQVAAEFNYPLLDAEQVIPGGNRYFSDATHFSYLGEQLFANALFQSLQNNPGLGADR